MLRKPGIVIAAVYVLGLGMSLPLAAVTHLLQDRLPVREEGVDYQVLFDVEVGQLDLYANGENCGNANHRTINGGRYFEHFHISYALPKTGVDNTGHIRTVTSGNTTAYWDNYYAGYTRIAAESIYYNCWGYSFNYDVWIQDPTYIYADDYQNTDNYLAGNKEASDNLEVHVINITAVNGEATGITQTIEKNQNSPIYRRNYDPARTVNNNYHMVESR